MSNLNDKLGRPILEDGTDPFFERHTIGSNYIASLYPRIRAERSANYIQSMMMVDLLLHKYEATYLPNAQDKKLLCLPYLFKEPEQGTKIRNIQTGEVYLITDTVHNPATGQWEGLVRIDAKTPPDKDLAEKLEFLDESVRVRFTAEFPRSIDTESQTEDELIKDAGPIRPTIAYALLRKEPGSIGRQPFAPQKQHKPIFRERLKPQAKSSGHTWEMYGHWFDVLVEFACFTTDNRSADQLADWFEEFMRQYTWVLKYNGVQEILYWQRLRDSAVTKWRQDLISRAVQYFFRIEEILPEIRKDLIGIDIAINLEEAITDASNRWYGTRYVTGQLTESEYRSLFRGQSGEYLVCDLILNDGNLL
jgi:hypothetical protein